MAIEHAFGPDSASVSPHPGVGTLPSSYAAPLVAPVTLACGGVLPMLIPLTEPVAQLPAASHTGAEIALPPTPSEVSVTGGGGGSVPSVSSCAVQVTITSD